MDSSTYEISLGKVISNWNPLKGSILGIETGIEIGELISPSPDPI